MQMDLCSRDLPACGLIGSDQSTETVGQLEWPARPTGDDSQVIGRITQAHLTPIDDAGERGGQLQT